MSVEDNDPVVIGIFYRGDKKVAVAHINRESPDNLSLGHLRLGDGVALKDLRNTKLKIFHKVNGDMIDQIQVVSVEQNIVGGLVLSAKRAS